MYAQAARRPAGSVAPPAATMPASGSWSPAASSSSVDLPQPEGPTTASTSFDRRPRSSRSRATRSPNRRLTPATTTPLSSNERGSLLGASASVCIAPSAGITPQVRRVSAGRRFRRGRYLSPLSREPPWLFSGAVYRSRRARPSLGAAVIRSVPYRIDKPSQGGGARHVSRSSSFPRRPARWGAPGGDAGAVGVRDADRLARSVHRRGGAA